MASRRRKLGIGCAVAFVVIAAPIGFVAYKATHHEAVPGVVSIQTTPEYQDPALLARAWALPVARTYRPIVSQPNGSVCGPTSVANVARSERRSPASIDGVLEGAGVCPFGFCFGGLSLDQLAEVARHAHTAPQVTVLRDLSLADFRAHLAHVNDPSRRYTINFDRGPLFGFRGGHHSPIAGYLEDRDLVFVLDVNTKYGPWLVDADRLYEAMDTVDSSTGRKRGLLLYEERH